MLVLKELSFMTPALGGLIAYMINTYIFYWFHRARHEIYLFWILFHQIHHSPARIEAITSFYKHPLEIFVDSLLMTILLYPILGLSSESSIWLSIFSAYGEYFYHMNIKTPHFIGYFFQRPESHRIHHKRNKRVNCKNYSDFPLWDMLGNTFENPPTNSISNSNTNTNTIYTGFNEEKEVRFVDMLLFRDVLKNKGNMGLNLTNFLSLCLLVIGLLQPIGYLFNQPNIRALGTITVASPLPLVFSAYNGVETFRTSFEIDLIYESDIGPKGLLFPQQQLKKEQKELKKEPEQELKKEQQQELKKEKEKEKEPEQEKEKEKQKQVVISFPLTKEIYSRIEGPYNRRNVLGVLFSHGPFFQQKNLIDLRDYLLKTSICNNTGLVRELFKELDLPKHLDLKAVQIKVWKRRGIGFWDMWIFCD
jgi:hypothetical protein